MIIHSTNIYLVPTTVTTVPNHGAYGQGKGRSNNIYDCSCVQCGGNQGRYEKTEKGGLM